MKKLHLLFLATILATTPALANEAAAPKQQNWAFEGVFGKFDKPSIQRGFQIYKEVCSACHSLKRVPFRKLTEIGFSEAEVKSLAAGYQIHDGPNDKAGRAMNNGALPPDQSLLLKAREDGANYIFSLLTGYGQAAPEGITVPTGAYYNPYMPGGIIKMAAPLKDDSVTYQDGTKATLDQEAHDIVNFLQWAAEPEMEERKHMGLHVLLFLGAMTAFFYVVKKRVWSNLH